MPISFLPHMPPEWVQKLISTTGDMPLVVLDFKNDRYWVEGHGEKTFSEVVEADTNWGTFAQNNLTSEGLTSRGTVRLTDIANNALSSGWEINNYPGVGTAVNLPNLSFHLKGGEITAVAETNFAATGSSENCEIRVYRESDPTKYYSGVHSALSSGSNTIKTHTTAHPLTGLEVTQTQTWNGSPQPGVSKFAANLNISKLRGSADGSTATTLISDLELWGTSPGGSRRVSIQAPQSGKLERVCLYRQQHDYSLATLSHPNRPIDAPLVKNHVFKAYAAVSAFGAGAYTMTVPFPRNYEVDDLFILWVSNTNSPVIAPDGWTQIEQVGQGTFGTSGTGQAAVLLAAFWKRATSLSETPPVLAASDASSRAAIITLYRGVKKTGNPIDASASFNNSTTSIIQWPQVTTTANNCRLVYGSANGHNGWVKATTGINERIIKYPPATWEHEALYQNDTSNSGSGTFEGTGDTVDVFGEYLHEKGQSPARSVRTHVVSNISTITLALLPDITTLTPLVLETIPAKRNEWRTARISNRTEGSVLSLITGETADFEAKIFDDPARILFRPTQNFAPSTHQITVREEYESATNGPLDTILSLSIDASTAIAAAPDTERRRQPRNWYSGGQSVFQFSIIPKVWNPAWSELNRLQTGPYLSINHILRDEHNNLIKGVIQPNTGALSFNWSGGQENQLTSPDGSDRLNVVAELSQFALQTITQDDMFIDYELVNKQTGEFYVTADHAFKYSGFNPIGSSANLAGWDGLQSVSYRHAQRDPVTRQITRFSEWTPITLEIDGNFHPPVGAFEGASAPNPNLYKAKRNRFPLIIKIPIPEPRPANFSIRLGDDLLLVDADNAMKKYSLSYTLNASVAGTQTGTFNLPASSNELANSVKVEVSTGLATLSINGNLPYSVNEMYNSSHSIGDYHESGLGSHIRVTLSGTSATNFTRGTTNPVIGSGTINSGNVGMGTNVYFVSPNTLTPTQHAGILVDDIICVVILTGNETVTTPTGWRKLASDGFGTPADSIDALGASLFWKRATANAEVIPGFGTFTYKAQAVSFFIRGARKTGNPFVNVGVNKSSTSVTQTNYGAYITRGEMIGIIGVACLSVDNVAYGTSTAPVSTAEPYVTGTHQWRRALTGSNGGGGTIGVWETSPGRGLTGVDERYYDNTFVNERKHTFGFANFKHNQPSSPYISFTLAVAREEDHSLLPVPTAQLSNPTEMTSISAMSKQQWYTSGGLIYNEFYVSTEVSSLEYQTPAPYGCLQGRINIREDDFYYNGLLKLGLSATSAYEGPYVPPTVLLHEVDFVNMTATINSTVITDFSTILDGVNPAAYSAAGLTTRNNAFTNNQPNAIGPLFDILRNQNYCIVFEFDLDVSTNTRSEYLMDFNTTSQSDGSEHYFYYGEFVSSDWNGNYVSVSNLANYGGRNKVAISFNGDKNKFCVNGGPVQSNLIQYPTLFDVVRIGSSTYGNDGLYNLNGTIRSIKIYNNGRGTVELTDLTTLN